MRDINNVLLIHSNLTDSLYMEYFEALDPFENKLDEVSVPVIVKGYENQDVGPSEVQEMFDNKGIYHYGAVLVHTLRKDLAVKVREEGYRGPVIGVEFDKGENAPGIDKVLTGNEMARDNGLLKRTIESYLTKRD